MNKRNFKEYSGFVLGIDNRRGEKSYCIYYPMNNHFYYLTSLENENIYPFDEDLYNKKIKENDKVYTIMYAIKENGSDIGYYIGNNKGEIAFYFKAEVLNLFEKYPFMNYKVIKKGKKCQLQRNRKDVVEYIPIEDFNSLIGYDIRNFILTRNMDINEFRKKLLEYGFKCGAEIPFKRELNGEKENCIQFVYYNKQGFLVVLNYSELSKLSEFKNFFICMRQVNNDEYHKYLQNHNFMIQSSENFDENYYIFIGTNLLHTLSFSEDVKLFSTHLVPLKYKDENYLEFLFTTSKQKRLFKEKINKCYYKDLDKYIKLGIILCGFYNIENHYDDNLKYLYLELIKNKENILNNFLIKYAICEETLSVFKIWLEEINET